MTQSTQTVLIGWSGVLFVVFNTFVFGPQASGRQAAGRGLRPVEDCRVGVGDQFRHHPAPVHRLFADDSLVHSWRDQGRVLCRSPVCRYAFRSPPRPASQGGCPHIHQPVSGLDCRDHHRPPARVAPRHRCGRRATQDLCLGCCLAAAALFAPAAGSRLRLQGLVARPDGAIGTVGCPSCNSVSALQCQLHAGCVLGSVHADLGTESYIAALAGPFIGLGCGYLLVSSLRVKDVAIRHAAEATTAVRNIAPMLLMMIYYLCRRPAGHGVDHDPQHHRHRDRSAIRPDVETRRVTIGHPRNNQPASRRRPTPANFDVTSDPPVVADPGQLPLPHRGRSE